GGPRPCVLEESSGSGGAAQRDSDFRVRARYSGAPRSVCLRACGVANGLCLVPGCGAAKMTRTRPGLLASTAALALSLVAPTTAHGASRSFPPSQVPDGEGRAPVG